MHNRIRFAMLLSIQFNNQLCTAAIKVNDIPSKLFLAPELVRMLFKEFIPKAIFMNSRFPAQFLRPQFQRPVIVDFIHQAFSPSP